MSETAHTPTPWTTDQTSIHSADMRTLNIAKCSSAERRPAPQEKAALIDFEECEANAAFIVHACNMHDGMLAALKLASTIIGHPDDSASKLIAEVISEAEGRT